MEFLDPKDGVALAERNLPRIECEISAAYDCPCSIDFSWEPGQSPGPIEFNPLIYWWAARDDDVEAYGYCVYHYRDIHHRHDFTGIIILDDGFSRYSVLRSHWDLNVYRVQKPGPLFYVEQGTHSIRSGRSRPGYTRLIPKFRIDEIGCLSHPGFAHAWQVIRRRFAPSVTLPLDWDDQYMNVYAQKNPHAWGSLFGSLVNSRGMIYNSPKNFLRAAKALGRIVGAQDERPADQG